MPHYPQWARDKSVRQQAAEAQRRAVDAVWAQTSTCAVCKKPLVRVSVTGVNLGFVRDGTLRCPRHAGVIVTESSYKGVN